ncbi:hypothetical protein V5799_013225 [Amblyomma americanum]|uniref:Uncharacterized protein n=1 Tax=Amblyomma americanum TaxID=6943 RepID=A0AAQ4E6H3_AMBAM
MSAASFLFVLGAPTAREHDHVTLAHVLSQSVKGAESEKTQLEFTGAAAGCSSAQVPGTHKAKPSPAHHSRFRVNEAST